MIIANSNPLLNCIDTEIVLDGSNSATDEGVIYTWTDEANTALGNANTLTVSEPGTYTLTVDLNGCINSAQAIVSQDISVPEIPTANVSGDLDCDNQEVTLSTDATGVDYNWQNGSFSSTEQNPTVTDAGIYTLIITNPNNGCTSSTTVEVIADANLPSANASVVDNEILNCETTDVSLEGTSDVLDATLSWTGPNGFTSNEMNPTVSDAGDYILTVLATNGCESQSTVTVLEDITVPETPMITTNGIINCTSATTEILITPIEGDSYEWFDVLGNSLGNETSLIIDSEGSYTLVVTGSNACTAEVDINITSEISTPTVNASVANNEILSCVITEVSLVTTTDAIDASFLWSGPNGYTSIEMNPVVTVAGEYNLVLTDANGCTAATSVTVETDGAIPTATLSVNGTITCDNVSVDITASSTDDNITYSWVGPNGFTSTNPSETVTIAGIYTLTVIADNGCESNATIEVLEDTTPPIANAGADISLDDCENINVTLNGDDSETGISYEWIGSNITNANSLNPTVSEIGTYILTVIGDNGCSSSDQVSVTCDTSTVTTCVGLSVYGFYQNILSADNPTTRISALCNSSDVTYTWTGPNGYQSNERTNTISEPGIYTITVSSTIENCSVETTIEVLEISDLRTTDIDFSMLYINHEITIQEETEKRFLDIYPNPSNGQFFVNMKFAQEEQGQLLVYSALGELVLKQSIQAQSFEEEINLQGLTSGIYIVIWKSEKDMITKKISIQ